MRSMKNFQSMRTIRSLKKTCAGLSVVLIFAGIALAQAQSAQQSANQTKTDSNTTKKSSQATKKEQKKPATAHKPAPPASNVVTVWVNTDSRIYHKPGTRWYGKTKHGKYMTEADAIKAGYHAAAKE